jgi:hypothetical protein
MLQRNDSLDGILLADLDVPNKALSPNDQYTGTVQLPDEVDGPPRWNPFGDFTMRGWRRGEVRLQVVMSNRPDKRYFVRLKRRRGVFVEASPTTQGTEQSQPGGEPRQQPPPGTPE